MAATSGAHEYNRSRRQGLAETGLNVGYQATRMSSPTGETRDILVMLRLEPGDRLPVELDAVFGYSISRALDCIDQTDASEVRIGVTRRIITPLERARSILSRALQRGGGRPPERILLPADVVELAETQLRALCQAALYEDFAWDDVPDCLLDPMRVRDHFDRALGRRQARARVRRAGVV